MGRKRIALLVVSAVAAAALLVGCAAPAHHLRVMTYNIHHGEGTDGRFDLQRIAQVINQQQPDLVSLQEVDRGTGRAGGVDQALELARLTNMDMAYGKAMDYDGGAYGVAILSRTPLRLATAHPLPHGEGREPRRALSALINHEPAGEVLFIATHLQHNSEDDRVAEAKRISELFVAAGGPPIVLAGDLNAQPTSPPMDVLLKDWRDAAAEASEGRRAAHAPGAPGAAAPTWPSDEPRVRIDYVLFRPLGAWRVIEAKVIDETIASDHRPLLVVLQWQGKHGSRGRPGARLSFDRHPSSRWPG